MKIKNGTTERGFAIKRFVDLYGEECSIQKSSLATVDAIWIGITEAEPKILAKMLRDDLHGWVKFPIPDCLDINTRMHLNRDQVKELIPILQKFVETGDL